MTTYGKMKRQDAVEQGKKIVGNNISFKIWHRNRGDVDICNNMKITLTHLWSMIQSTKKKLQYMLRQTYLFWTDYAPLRVFKCNLVCAMQTMNKEDIFSIFEGYFITFNLSIFFYELRKKLKKIFNELCRGNTFFCLSIEIKCALSFHLPSERNAKGVYAFSSNGNSRRRQ